MKGYSRRACAYFEARAIDRQLAWDCGVRETDGAIVWPTVDADGNPAPRRRKLAAGPGPKVRGPYGKTVGVWWPLGRPEPPVRGDVLICEGESDPMAAVSVLQESDHVYVCSGKASVKTLAAELTGLGVSVAALGFDGDTAGALSAGRHAQALVAEGIGVRILSVPDGEDLASVLGALDDPRAWLLLALAQARPVGLETAALVAENRWLRRRCVDLLLDTYPGVAGVLGVTN
jgi:hypothetical protein